MHYFTYILRCCDNSLYTGYTNNLELRIEKHNEWKWAKYTRGRTPVQLVYFESFETKSEAMKREREIKKLTKSKKELLLQIFAIVKNDGFSLIKSERRKILDKM